MRWFKKIVKWVKRMHTNHQQFGFGIFIYHKGWFHNEDVNLFRVGIGILFLFWMFEFEFKIR